MLRRIRDAGSGADQPVRRPRRRPDDARASSAGGNLQKVVLGREFSGHPNLLVAAAPTRGLDVGAIETVHRRLASSSEGGAILLISARLDEVLRWPTASS